MKKRLLAFIMTLTLGITLLAGCSSNDQKGGSDVSLATVHQAVKDAYGENYLPSMAFTEEEVAEKFGIQKDLTEEVIAEGPMMSTQVDTFVAVRAKEGKADEVEKALNSYRETQVQDSLQYPMNQPKVEASQVVKVGNDVFFLMLGAYPEDPAVEESEEKLADYYKEQTKLGVDAINKALGK